jgi:hypothetical protein
MEWSKFTEEEYPASFAKAGTFIAEVRLCDTNEESGWGNRRWRVLNGEYVVIASGYTLGSYAARKMCQAVLLVWGRLPEEELTIYSKPILERRL